MLPAFNPSCTQLPLPLLQQATSWDTPVSLPVHDVPPISQMLVQEAEAWRALLGLHGSVMSLARGTSSQSVQEAANAELHFDEQNEASAQREASYIAGLAQLVAQCDMMVAEATKMRGLRKAKHQLEVQALRVILQTHANEVLAVGEALARNSSISIASATSEMRQAAQATRAQIQQTRLLLHAASEMRALGNTDPRDFIVMGWRDAAGDMHDIRPIAKVLEQVYQRGQLTDENLRAAIWDGDAPGSVAVPAQRTFSRRLGERDVQQQLVQCASAESGSSQL